MTSSAIQLFLSLSKLINLHNPLLLMTHEEQIPLPFCSGMSLPIICYHYAPSESSDVAERIKSSSVNYNPTFISNGNHIDLIMKLRGSPLLFSGTHLWVIPFEYKSVVPRRLDNNILFYEKNATGGFNIYESYCVKNDEQGAVTNMLFHMGDTGENKPQSKLNINILDQRSSMNGAILKNSFKNHKRNVIYIYDKNGNIIKPEGMYIDIMDILQDKLNCVFESKLWKKSNYGKRLDNGTWTGIIGMLTEDKLDVSLTYPNCDEIVQWIVMDTPLYVRRDGLVSIEQTLFLLLGPQTYCFSSML